MTCPAKYECSTPAMQNCTVTWSIAPRHEVPPHGEVELTMQGLAANAAAGIRVVLPNNSAYIWHVKADANGRIAEKIKLTSGVGEYCFLPCVGCCQLLPTSMCVTVANCVSERVATCAVTLVGSVKQLIGGKNLLVATNLRPFTFVTLSIVESGHVTPAVYHAQTNASGEFTYEFSQTNPRAASYTASVTDGTCTSPPFAFEYVNSQNLPTLLTVPPATCDEAIHATARFDRSSYAPGTSGTLFVTVCNRRNVPQSVNYSQLGVFPAYVVFPAPPTINAVISPNACVDYPFFFNVANNAPAATVSAAFTGTYVCNDQIYKIQSNSPSFDVATTASTCALTVVSWSFNTASVRVNATGLILSLVLRNTGTAPQSSVQLLAGVLPAGLNSTPIGFANVNIAANDTHTYIVQVVPKSVGTYTIALDAGDVLGNCRNVTNAASTATLVANLTVVP